MEIAANFLQENKIAYWQVKEKFKSKKNDVYLIEAADVAENSFKWVIKIYDNEENQKKEVKFLEFLNRNKVKVPAVYCIGSNYIIMEYISCWTILDYLSKCEENDVEIDRIKSFILSLSSWLKSFYQTVKARGNYILGDVNYRNFMFIDENNIYGIDFENCYWGKKEEDVGRICAFGLTYHPAFTTWKYRFVNKLLQIISAELSLNIDHVKQECLKELTDIKMRRNIMIPSNEVIIHKLFIN